MCKRRGCQNYDSIYSCLSNFVLGLNHTRRKVKHPTQIAVCLISQNNISSHKKVLKEGCLSDDYDLSLRKNI